MIFTSSTLSKDANSETLGFYRMVHYTDPTTNIAAKSGDDSLAKDH